MINLYYGRSDIDRTEFMYEKTAQFRAEQGKAAFIIVPDQYTLEAEKTAFRFLKAEGLMDIEILSFSRLATKLIGGKGSKKYLDDTGRSMLLRRVISSNRDKLRVFASAVGKNEFVKMMGSMIQEFKQNNVSVEGLREIAEENSEKYHDRMLIKKLSDAILIYEAYEAELEGKYFDTEDYISRLCDEIGEGALFEDCFVWIEGFDFFSKRLISVMESIALKANQLNISIVYSKPGSRDYNLFAPLESTIEDIKKIGEDIGEKVNFLEIPEKYRNEKSGAIKTLEENLYAFPPKSIEGIPLNVEICHCEDKETEVEYIAEEIIRLVEREGYRFKDIAIATNEAEDNGDLFDRIFSRAKIAYYRDEKQSAVWNRYMQFILAMCTAKGIFGSNEDIFRLLYAGVLDISADERELLENYVHKYGVEGILWKRDFNKADFDDKSEEEAKAELEAVNSIRQKLEAAAEALEGGLKTCHTGREYSRALFTFLKDYVHMDELVVSDGDRLKREGLLEFAQTTVQIWNRMTAILGQLEEILGDYECELDEFFEILKAGIETMELGRIPTTIDRVYIGSYESVGFERAKVLFAMGMNDGSVPSSGGSPGILSDFEKKKLNEIAGKICNDSASAMEKEKLGIYKTLSMPSDRLYLSCILAKDNQEMIPSQLLERVKRIFPQISEKRRVSEYSSQRGEYIYRSRIEYMQEYSADSEDMKYIQAGKDFRNSPEGISKGNFEELYGEVPILSPTSLERYSRCPYAHFMRYAIKADERRVFEISASELGTVFHETIMRFSQQMSDSRKWSLVDEAICKETVEKLAEAVVEEFKKGFLFEGPIGKYRLSRVKSVCENTAYMIAKHIQSGEFDSFFFEIPFGEEEKIPPITLETESGGRVLIEGRIDRVDICEKEGKTLVKVIDYKSGSDKVVREELESGYRLQLMLYMNAALSGMRKDYMNVAPAGVFYFKIQEPSINIKDKYDKDSEGVPDYVNKERRKSYKMDGIVVNEPEIISAFDGDFSQWSEIIKVRKLKAGVKGTGDFTALDKEEFDELMKNTIEKTEALCNEFTKGSVEIRPMKVSADESACTYCRYKSICNFDIGLPGFIYSS